MSEAKEKELLKASICTIHDLIQYLSAPSDFTDKVLTSLRNNVPNNILLSPLSTIEYRAAPNPYLSLWGTNWLAKISTSVTLKHTCDIRELVMHVHNKIKQVFANAKCHGNFFFYHNTLS